MATAKLYPTSTTDTGSVINTGNHLDIDETSDVSGGAGDGNVIATNVNDQTGSTVSFALSDLPGAADTINSATLRVRARMVNVGGITGRDVLTYVVRAGTDGAAVSWNNSLDSSETEATKTASLTSETVASLNAETIEVENTVWSQNKGADNTYFEIEFIEIEVDYTLAADDLLADDVETNSWLTSPAAGIGTEDLDAAGVESASEVSTPIARQALTADDIESASEVTTPDLTVIVNFNADSVESASEVSIPTLQQIFALNADDVEVFSWLTTPVAENVTDALEAADITSTSYITTPTAEQIHVLNADDLESASEVETVALGGEHTLLADDIESASEVTSVALGIIGGDTGETKGFNQAFMSNFVSNFVTDFMKLK